MKRLYLVLALATIVAAAGLTLLSRMPRATPHAPAPAPAVPEVPVALDVRDGVVSPEAASVPKNYRVRLAITNHGARPARVELSGYEDRVAVAVAPGTTWTGVFVADRPGDDLAWRVDGKPAGRFSVLGSHLEEGHR